MQSLINTRLDTIDRLLLGQVSRVDRVSIVKEVESQIYELIALKDADSISREDVLEILGKLDPPEAYLPEEGSTPERVIIARKKSSSESIVIPIAKNPPRELGRLGGILGLTSLGMLLLSFGVLILIALKNYIQDPQNFAFALGFSLIIPVATCTSGLVVSIIGVKRKFMPIAGIIASTMTISIILALIGLILFFISDKPLSYAG
ncbi:hypothetical protein KIH39_14790 [Telmatocola sphagniphila]|uniref:Uncharacterized protein n=1 Tax=Telmatocola sphagniphila TaxID=1123043 RepID=A0A8E6B2L0_9BACT|nr:hypothetical protein [Telmatocola sphagniphila]QVL30122.1 hypothetical protein KIH39_14790 [Telmatocola sphagniphila]